MQRPGLRCGRKGAVRAVLISAFGAAPELTTVADPEPRPDGVLVKVEATGLCRSDWHGWQGHDRDIVLPHVPGHELAGTVAALGSEVTGWRPGDRVTVPFICACGSCAQCRSGRQQTCTRQLQPGFTLWGSFAEYVAIPFAEGNLIRLPDAVGFPAAAALGCRFATAFRAVTAIGRVQPGEWVAVFGCGGVGLSAVMIAAAAGARVIAVDRQPAALALAGRHGAAQLLPAGPGVVGRLVELTGGGPEVTVDAIGAESVVQACLDALRPGGRHLQVGILPQPIRVDLSLLPYRELSWLGSHGMAAHDYPRLLALVESGTLRPDQLITGTISLAGVGQALAEMTDSVTAGITMIDPAG
jgi:D-arabinose 1-dehydrogenase-like Zn-dependent alcohol dehydrogenase